MNAENPPDTLVPSEVAQAAQAVKGERPDTSPPAWVNRFVWQSAWKVVVVVALAALAVVVVMQLRHLIGVLVISLFFALAIIPGVEALVRRFHMRRGAAVGIIFITAMVAVVLMVAFLIPAIVQFASAVGAHLNEWLDNVNQWSADYFGGDVVDTEAAEEATAPILRAVQEWGDNVLGIVSSGLGLVFDVFTILTFTFYFAADFPRLLRTIMRRMPPQRQQVVGWVARTSIEQTGGYFYSRLLLMIICGTGAFFVMLLVGLPLVYALPMALFMGFVSEFIPFIGTYVGAIVPSLVVLAVEGFVPTLVLVAYVLVYQQIENYVLNPRLSSKTMELNGAVAFGGAMAGGAIAGPMGAFMALPVAALITSIAKNTGRTYEVVEQIEAGEGDEAGNAAAPASAPAVATPSQGTPGT
ncbi:AI-2E family transporter [Demequina sp. NBRC 110055]|uniref:AI-2E family transporter n=1 Tax=Demequina sp. NBRC 110055 TaxID=1570344 RepID=UPI0013566C33|nr:AI-2E family transporter [Demequina sp. NBRC 110055]